MRVTMILPAAGSSSRYSKAGGLRSKLDEDLGGRPVLQRTVELFTKRDEVAGIIVAGPHDEEAYEEFCGRHADKLALLGVRICRGGKTHRHETVASALELVDDQTTHIGVHDAARPCTPDDLLERVFDGAHRHDAVIPAIDVPDTIKRVSEMEDAGEDDPLDAILGGAGKANRSMRRVSETIPRTGLVLVQTPQMFSASLLRRAYAQQDLTSTDDASLVERLGEVVTVVEGDPRNIKITLPKDLALARSILGVRTPSERPTHKRF